MALERILNGKFQISGAGSNFEQSDSTLGFLVLEAIDEAAAYNSISLRRTNGSVIIEASAKGESNEGASMYSSTHFEIEYEGKIKELFEFFKYSKGILEPPCGTEIIINPESQEYISLNKYTKYKAMGGEMSEAEYETVKKSKYKTEDLTAAKKCAAEYLKEKTDEKEAIINSEQVEIAAKLIAALGTRIPREPRTKEPGNAWVSKESSYILKSQ